MSSSDSSFSVETILVSACSAGIFHGEEYRLTLLLLLLSGGGVRGTTSSGGSATGGGGGTTTGADVHEQVLDVLTLEGLGEEGGPDGLDVLNLGGGDERLELVGLFAKCVSKMFSGDNDAAMVQRARAQQRSMLAILLVLPILSLLLPFAQPHCAAAAAVFPCAGDKNVD